LLRVGRVVHYSPTNSKRVVIKAENIPPVGATVTDAKGIARGFVFDVFGSTSSPYIEIESVNEFNNNTIGQIMFFKPSYRNKKKGKGKRWK
jgi:rRNA processing protein Gar1